MLQVYILQYLSYLFSTIFGINGRERGRGEVGHCWKGKETGRMAINDTLIVWESKTHTNMYYYMTN